MFIDTHTHLNLSEFDNDHDEVIQRAIDSGVDKMIIPNIDEASITNVLEMCRKYPLNCYPLLGLHPESVNQDFEFKLKTLDDYLQNNKFFGIGETGLDYYWDITYKEQQILSFEHHIEWAIQYNLPLVVHIRKSREDVINILRKYTDKNLKGIFHCFSGSVEDALETIDLGFHLGIGGVLTFKNGKLEDVIKTIPLEWIVLETDSPFLAPVPFRGKRNESSYIPKIAEKIAELKNITLDEVAEITTNNALSLFRL